MSDAAHTEREHFFGAAKVIALLTVLSRVLGMVRDMSIVWLGTKWQNDAFQFAFALPNLFRRLFGEGALTAAFVPVLTETMEQSGVDKARRLLANTMGILAVFLIVLWVLVQGGLWVWLACSPGRADRQFLVLLTSIMLPYLVLVCLLALGASALNCRGHFAYPAAAPIILNVCMIAADGVAAFFWHGSRDAQLTTISVSVTFAGVLQLGGAMWLLHRSGFGVLPHLRPIEPGVRKVLTLMAPALLGMGFLQISSFFDYVVALFLSPNQYATTLHLFGWEIQRPLQEGVLVRVTAAQRLYQFPMGVFAISLGTAVFPLLSRYAARGDLPNLRDGLNRALRLAVMEGLATGVGLFVLAGPIVRLIYRHQAFLEADAERAASILQMYAIGMWAFCMHQMLTRTFYSLKDPKTPLRIACLLSGVYMVLVVCLIWVPAVRERAFGLTPTITFAINVAILTAILRKRLGRLGGRRLALSAARSAACSAIMAGVIYLLWWLLGAAANWVVVAVCVPAGAAAFVASALALRAPELGEMFGAMRRQKTPATESPGESV